MWWMLAQASVTEGVLCTGGGIAVTLLTLAIKRGINLRIGNGKSGGRDKPCPLHEPMFKMMDERHMTLLGAIGKVETGIMHIHERLDDVLSRRTN